MKKSELQPVGFIRNSIYKTGLPENLEQHSVIELADESTECAYDHLSVFSHLEIVYYFSVFSGPFLSGTERRSPEQHASSLFGHAIVRLIDKKNSCITVT